MHGSTKWRRVDNVPAVKGGRTGRGGIHEVRGVGVVVVKSRAGSRARTGAGSVTRTEAGSVAPAGTRAGTRAWVQVARAWSGSYTWSST